MRPIGRENVGGTVKYVSERDCIGECLIVIESECLCVLIRNPSDPANRLLLLFLYLYLMRGIGVKDAPL
jgi:hypothetical protein